MGILASMSTSKFFLASPLLLVLVLTACGDGKPDPDLVAAAKCHLPLVQKLQVSSAPGVNESNIEVRDLGNGRREVTGDVSVSPGGSTRRYVCVVTPDASDTLRGLRVERLDLQ